MGQSSSGFCNPTLLTVVAELPLQRSSAMALREGLIGLLDRQNKPVSSRDGADTFRPTQARIEWLDVAEGVMRPIQSGEP